jgi:hypothetical protein
MVGRAHPLDFSDYTDAVLKLEAADEANIYYSNLQVRPKR